MYERHAYEGTWRAHREPALAADPNAVSGDDDALAPVVDIDARDELHRHSKLSAAAKAVICGLGPYGYIVAMQAAVHLLGHLPQALPEPIRVGPLK